jgi:hypothetical protein
MKVVNRSNLGSENKLVTSAAEQMRKILERVVPVFDVHREAPLRDVEPSASKRVDLEIDLVVHGKQWKLLLQATSSGEPRFVREKLWWLQRALRGLPATTYGIVAAPFLSLESQDILRESGFGWMDMVGNCRLVFNGVHVEIEKAAKNPFVSKRSQRSIFAPKSARLLRMLLANPGPWKVSELAAQAGVSVGQVSKVRQALLEKEWAVAEIGGGLRIHRSGAVLDAWRDVARQPEVIFRGYTLLHGKELEAQLQKVFAQAQEARANLQFASYSVARRLAPFARVAGEFFYADSSGVEIIKQQLKAEPVTKGENIVIYGPVDERMWDEGIALSHNMHGTSLVQTYLDLWNAGDRGREAAEHLRREAMTSMIRVNT